MPEVSRYPHQERIPHETSRSRFFSLAILKSQFTVRKKSAPMHITSTGPQRLDPGGLLSQSFSCNMTGPSSLPAFRVEYPPHGTAQSLSSALQRVKSAPGQNHFSSGRAFTRCTGLLLGQWCPRATARRGSNAGSELRVLCEWSKRVFDLVKDFGTPQSPKSTRSSTAIMAPAALRPLSCATPRSDAPLGSPLAPSARRVSRVASRLPGTTRLRFALHGGQRRFMARSSWCSPCATP